MVARTIRDLLLLKFALEANKKRVRSELNEKGRIEMFNVGTLLDANSIARSPFLQPEDVRFSEKPPGIFDTYSAWRLCKKRATHPNIVTFGDVKPESCMTTLAMYVRASLLRDEECLGRILDERRAIYDPTVLPWKPKQLYLELLSYQQRLPADVEDQFVAEFEKQQKEAAAQQLKK